MHLLFSGFVKVLIFVLLIAGISGISHWRYKTRKKKVGARNDTSPEVVIRKARPLQYAAFSVLSAFYFSIAWATSYCLFEGEPQLAVARKATILIFGLIYSYFAVKFFRGLSRNRRLVLLPSEIRLVENADEVLGVLPFGNIGGCTLFSIKRMQMIGVRLIDPLASDTFWPGKIAGKGGFPGNCHVTIESGFEEPTRLILDWIQRRRERFTGRTNDS